MDCVRVCALVRAVLEQGSQRVLLFSLQSATSAAETMASRVVSAIERQLIIQAGKTVMLVALIRLMEVELLG